MLCSAPLPGVRERVVTHGGLSQPPGARVLRGRAGASAVGWRKMLVPVFAALRMVDAGLDSERRLVLCRRPTRSCYVGVVSVLVV